MRGKKATKRILPVDHIYGSQLVTKLINMVMEDGKKGVATKLVYTALEIMKDKTGVDPVEGLEKAIENAAPRVEVRTRRVGGANYPIPVPVNGDRQNTLALRWIVATIASRNGTKSSAQVLADELMASMNGEGSAIKKKMDVERMAEANRAFASLGAS